MNEILKYYIGNARNIDAIFKRRNIPKPSLIISSPPYFDLLDYDGVKKQIGFGQNNYELYLNDVVTVFHKCYELAEDNATFWLIVDTLKKKGELITLPFDINRKLKEYKETWKLKDIIIWDKEKNLPWNSKGKFKNQFEYILFFTKSSNFKFKMDAIREINDLKKWWLSYPERYNPKGKAPSNVWQFTIPIRGWGNGKQNHFCPIPFPLAEKIISISTDNEDVIFDPFAGSGSALALASNMGRHAYGIDINMNYKKRFMKEIITGAKSYWDKRKAELKHNSNAIKKFSTTNRNLRKLKVATAIAKHINSTYSNAFVYVLLNKPGSKLDLIIIENGIKPITDISDEKLNSLINQAKIQPNIQVINEQEITSRIKAKKLNRYSLDKFYSINRTINRDNLIRSKTRHDFIHTNISLRIR
ncbi:MAG: site-specific DNA-methyltransferase [Armatimonadetes bacterium]|nr:site-specific DNA-methyltransferase [Armatimonadota bacterium]